MDYKKRILITGGAGFIGNHAIRYFLEHYPNYLVICYDKLTYAGTTKWFGDIWGNNNFRFIQGDVCDANMVNIILNSFNVDTIIHFAAESHVDNSINDPSAFIQTNIVGTYTLIECARKFWEENGGFEGKRFHHVSTDEVFGSLPLNYGAKFTESTPYDPHSPYSASKASSDMLVKSYYTTYGFPATISNCSNNYGPYQHKEKLIPTVINCIKQGKSIPVYGNGNNVRDWLYVTDHIRAIDDIIHYAPIGETYNIGGNMELTNISLIYKIGQAYREITGEFIDIGSLITYVEDRKGHDLRYAVSYENINTQLEWEPTTSFDVGIMNTVKWYLEHE